MQRIVQLTRKAVAGQSPRSNQGVKKVARWTNTCIHIDKKSRTIWWRGSSEKNCRKQNCELEEWKKWRWSSGEGKKGVSLLWRSGKPKLHADFHVERTPTYTFSRLTTTNPQTSADSLPTCPSRYSSPATDTNAKPSKKNLNTEMLVFVCVCENESKKARGTN